MKAKRGKDVIIKDVMAKGSTARKARQAVTAVFDILRGIVDRRSRRGPGSSTIPAAAAC